MWERLVYEFKWLRWFISGLPYDYGLDRESKRILFRRWNDKEPDFKGRYPHRRET
jgi:hypothetical protein